MRYSFLERLWKPWFVYCPMRFLQRAAVAIRPPSPGYKALGTSFGVRITADPTRTIGRSILTTGVYDLAVSEVLARLISPGDTVVDAGANIGYMTVLASLAAGPKGRVLAFEPHPTLFSILQANVTAAGRSHSTSPTELFQTALGEHSGTAELQLPPDFASNDGIARIDPTAASGGNSVTVQVETLDHALGAESAAVLKLDVEGYEYQVLSGADSTLSNRRIRHILFEDHAIEGSAVVRVLREAGYNVYSLGWTIRGPRVQPVEVGSLAAEYEAANFVATLDADDLLARCRPRGWLVLGRSLQFART